MPELHWNLTDPIKQLISCAPFSLDLRARIVVNHKKKARSTEHLCLIISSGSGAARESSSSSFDARRSAHRSPRSRSVDSCRTAWSVKRSLISMRDGADKPFQTSGGAAFTSGYLPTQQPQLNRVVVGAAAGGGGGGAPVQGAVNRVNQQHANNLSLQQLQDMAFRQQQQIEAQQQLLVAKEQRLKYLRQQDYNHHQLASEYERLRRLREKVEAQEMKLRKLRALRGGGGGGGPHVALPHPSAASGNSVVADLESIRALFNDKEKELSMAVRKVEELTHQLEDLRCGRSIGNAFPPQVVELERLRRELAYRKQLNEQQNQMIAQQKAQLMMGREEINRIDGRVQELQERLERKRMMNQQLANQISAATNAKQAQLKAMMMLGSNKNKPVSTVEPIQRGAAAASGMQQVDLHNHINKNIITNQQNATESGAAVTMNKYPTLPLVNRLNGGATKASLTDHQVNYSNQVNNNNNNGPATSSHTNMNKPVSSVAPVPILPPKPAATRDTDRSSSASPPPYIPAPPPPPAAQPATSSQNLITSSTSSASDATSSSLSTSATSAADIYPEEGTSVDDMEPDMEMERNNVLVTASGAGSGSLTVRPNVHISINRRIEMPPAFHFPEDQTPPSDLLSGHHDLMMRDITDNAAALFPMMHHIYKEFDHLSLEEKNAMSAVASANAAASNSGSGSGGALADDYEDEDEEGGVIGGSSQAVPEFVWDENEDRCSKPVGIIKKTISEDKTNQSRRVSFDPLALLLDASLEGELDLVKRTAAEVPNPSAANDEGITALHNAICAGHFDIVQFLVEFGCDVNTPDSDGWTPLHCAASCNNLPMVRFLVEHGACIFATTLSDHETAAEKCEEEEEGFESCSEYLYGIQDKLGIINAANVFAVYDYEPNQPDELGFNNGDKLMVLKKGDDTEKEWYWSKSTESGLEGYIPRNLIGLFPRVPPSLSFLKANNQGHQNTKADSDEDMASN